MDLTALNSTCVQQDGFGIQVDPHMDRTVLVSTKFDTRMPQFAAAEDAVAFLHPTKEQLSGGTMLGGGPFFTSVPSGRVGTADDSIFETCAACFSIVLHRPGGSACHRLPEHNPVIGRCSCMQPYPKMWSIWPLPMAATTTTAS